MQVPYICSKNADPATEVMAHTAQYTTMCGVRSVARDVLFCFISEVQVTKWAAL